MSDSLELKALVEDRLNSLLARTQGFEKGEIPGLLAESMRYSLLAGGKRLRPCMLLKACEINGGDVNQALDYACALEMIHTYSLIHDDLPGMDDDCLRRGKPTNHVVFGVGQAILTGDGLLSFAFETMLSAALNGSLSHENALKAIYAIARGAGVTGMVAGQCADLYAEERTDADEKMLEYIHAGKTAAMFIGAVQAGAHLAGAGREEIDALTRFASDFGRLFQVTDDILDVTAEADKFGKSKGKDETEGKLTAVSLMGLEGARDCAKRLCDSAIAALEIFGGRGDYFKYLTLDMAKRTY